MLNRSPMKRAAWPRRPAPAEKELNREQVLAERAQRAIKSSTAYEAAGKGIKIAVASMAVSVEGEFTSFLKQEYYRSEPYRRLMASLPCIRCNIQGYSQAAHPPPSGKGLKECDTLVFPLCCERIGIPGCHWLFDKYKLMPHAEAVDQAAQWAEQTQQVIINAGLWPEKLPKPLQLHSYKTRSA